MRGGAEDLRNLHLLVTSLCWWGLVGTRACCDPPVRFVRHCGRFVDKTVLVTVDRRVHLKIVGRFVMFLLLDAHVAVDRRAGNFVVDVEDITRHGAASNEQFQTLLYVNFSEKPCWKRSCTCNEFVKMIKSM